MTTATVPTKAPEQENQATVELSNQHRAGNRVVAPEYTVHRTEDAFTIRAEMPGVATDDLDLQLKDRLLSVKGKGRPLVFDGYEQAYGEFNTVDYAAGFRLSDQLDDQAIQATLTNGILTITVPKAKESLPRNIKVSSAS